MSPISPVVLEALVCFPRLRGDEPLEVEEVDHE